MSDKVYKVVTERIISKLSEGVATWRRSWNSASAPKSIHGRDYRGFNAFALAAMDYDSPFWITKKEIAKREGAIKKAQNGKAERYCPVMLWKWLTKEDKETGKKRRFPYVRFFQVWNLEQVDGIEVPKAKVFDSSDAEPIERCEEIVKEYDGPNISYNGSQPCYVPPKDLVKVPVMKDFQSAEAFYSTLFHELGHSTGHESRLNRPEIGKVRFGSHEYSNEELVAEMTAAFLCSKAGIENEATIEDNAAYCACWLRKLKDDPKMLVNAAQRAQKAADMILNVEVEYAEAKA